MASFTPVRGTRNEINAVSMVDGQFLYETDQGDGNRIYADIIDSNGDPKRVQVGGERGDQNRLVYLKDVALTNPQNNDYLKYDSVNQKWVNDGTLNNKIKNLDNNGQIDGTNVKYDNTTDMTAEINSKISMPTGGTTGDSLVLGIGNVPEWKQVRINVVDNLSSTSATDALSANQGRNLNSSISNLTTVVNQKVDAPKSAGTSGQVLALDAVGNTIWKTVTGGGGSGSSDWSDVTNKPFDIVYDQSVSANNADFDIQSQSTSGGTSVNVLYLNDDKIYRPTDTDDIATNTDPNYIPVSVNKADGGQEKKRISFSNFVDRIKNKIFKLSAVANGDFLRYDSTEQKWVNDSTVANKLYDIDDTTIIKNSVSNELEVPIDNNTIIVDSSDNKVKVSNDITTKLSKVDITDNLSVELGKKIDKPASATDGQVLTYNGKSNEWEAQNSKGGAGKQVKSCEYAIERWLRFDTSNRKGLIIKAGTSIRNSQGNYIDFDSDTSVDLTSVITTVGEDYYVYMLDDGSITASLTSATAPLNSVRIGRFHSLCVAVGTCTMIVPPSGIAVGSNYLVKSYRQDEDLDFFNLYNKSVTVTGTNNETLAHPLSGFEAGAILPESVMCLSFHSGSLFDDGQVYDKDTDAFIDIYLQSGIGLNTRSKYGATHTVSRTQGNHMVDMRQVGKKLLSDGEFESASIGSNQATNIQGSADKGTVGGHVDTANRRMISAIGVEEMCGYLWQWTRNVSSTGGLSWATTDGNGSFGQEYGTPFVLLAGGDWVGGSSCGSRSRASNNVRSTVAALLGGRGLSRVVRGV